MADSVNKPGSAPIFCAPTSLEEATALLSVEGAIAIAGGQWSVPQLRAGWTSPKTLVSLQKLKDLRGIRLDDQRIKIGAMETHASIASSGVVAEHLPALCHLSGKVGDVQVRNRGTMGGALIADPGRTDYCAALLALDGAIHTNLRSISAEEFLKSAASARLKKGEILLAVSVRPTHHAYYGKLAHPAGNHADPGLFLARFPDGSGAASVLGDGWPYRCTWPPVDSDGQAADLRLAYRPQTEPFVRSRLDALLSDGQLNWLG